MELFSELETNNKLQGKLGLKNYGDSSFVNAIVQAISNIEPVCFAIRWVVRMCVLQFWLIFLV
jgi:hypothetical protein